MLEEKIFKPPKVLFSPLLIIFAVEAKTSVIISLLICTFKLDFSYSLNFSRILAFNISS